MILVLGLDARRFSEGQRDALAAFKKGKEGAVDFGKQVEESGAKMADSFSVVRKGMLGVVAGIAGGGMISFVERIVQMDAATGRMAKTIGASVPGLSTWQYMMKQVGGEAASATSSLLGMQQTLERIRMGTAGAIDPNLAQLANQVGFNLMGSGTSDQFYRQVGAFFRGEIAGGRISYERAATRLSDVGLPQDMINALLGDFDAIEKAANKSAVASEKSAAEAAKSQAISSSRIQALERWGINIIEFLGKKPGDITREDFKKLNPFGGGAAEGTGTGANGAAIAGIESGGSYSKLGPITSSGDRAYGKYQVMGANIPAWTQEALGRSMTPQEFLNSPSAQDAVFNKKFGDYTAKYGPAGAAGAWFAGEGGMNDPNRRDMLGTSVQDYQNRFMGARGAASGRRSDTGGGDKVSSVTINNNISVKSTDPEGAANEIAGVMKRQTNIAGINNGLV